jgi:hypothetical protein
MGDLDHRGGDVGRVGARPRVGRARTDSMSYVGGQDGNAYIPDLLCGIGAGCFGVQAGETAVSIQIHDLTGL